MEVNNEARTMLQAKGVIETGGDDNRRAGKLTSMGPLTGGGGGVPMSHVESKKCQCPLSLIWPCHMSPLRCSHVACRI